MPILEIFSIFAPAILPTTKILFIMKVVLRTFVTPVEGCKKLKKVEKSIESIRDLKLVIESLDSLKQTVIDALTINDDGSNDFIKFSISIHYENPD